MSVQAPQSADFRPIVLLRFHDYFTVVEQRTHWLRKLNPGIQIHALYGGAKPVPPGLSSLFDGIFTLDIAPELAWRNVDLALLEWFRANSKDVAFSHAYICEWDLVYTAPLRIVLPIPQQKQSLLSGYTPLSAVEWKWDPTNGKKLGPLNEWLELKRFVYEKYRYAGPYYACIGPAAVLSREFFEYYAKLEMPLLCHDELRLPLIHSLGHLEVADTGLYPLTWYLPEHEAWIRRFNVRRWEVEPKTVAVGTRSGFFAYHPVRKLLDERLLKRQVPRYNDEASAPFVNGS